MGNTKQNAGSCLSCIGFIFIFIGATNMGVYMGPYTFPTEAAMMMGIFFVFTGFAFEMLGLILMVMGKRDANRGPGDNVSAAIIRRAQRNRTISNENPQNELTCNRCGSNALTDDLFCTNCHTYSLDSNKRQQRRPNIQEPVPISTTVEKQSNEKVFICPNCNHECSTDESFCGNCGRYSQ